MYGVTNREVTGHKDKSDKLGPKPNRKGPNELRLFKAEKSNGDWYLEAIADRLSKDMKAEVNAPASQPAYGSYYVAKKVLRQARKEERNVLVFVHGYNNDIYDVLHRASELEERYGVIVVPFTWPANGGGIISGTLDYKSDKRDARVSVGALDRTFEKAAEYLVRFTEEVRRELWKKAAQEHGDNRETREARYSELLDKECPFTINAMFHSMGNYLLKHHLKSSVSEGNRLLFHNVVLAAADTNNAEHRTWVDSIKFRRRLYVTINENDRALGVSRAKAGEEQRARLGHSLFDLESRKAAYIDFSSASWVGDSHAYFEGEPVEKNDDVREFFHAALNGKVAEEGMRYVPDRNVYQFRNR